MEERDVGVAVGPTPRFIDQGHKLLFRLPPWVDQFLSIYVTHWEPPGQVLLVDKEATGEDLFELGHNQFLLAEQEPIFQVQRIESV